MGEPPVVVVGGGLAGVACARALAGAGRSVRLIDRGRRLGGRMSGRRLDDRHVDLGASYFTVSDDGREGGFGDVVDDWAARGLAVPWTDTFLAAGPTTVVDAEVKTGPVRWGTPGGLRGLVEDLAAPLPDVVTGVAVERVDVGPAPAGGAATLRVDGEPAAAVVLAVPDPQASRLLGVGLEDVAGRLQRRFEPALALAARWPTRTWDAGAPTGRFDGAFVADHEVLAWVADDGRRRGDDAPVLVAHSTPSFAARHLHDPSAAAPEMTAALADLLGITDRPASTHVHRWSFATPAGDRPEPYLLTDVAGADGVSGVSGGAVGACGDGWGPTSKVETAYLSGRALGLALAARDEPA